MNKYYKPLPEELKVGLEIQVYDSQDSEWLTHKLKTTPSSNFLALLETGDIRVEYLKADDFLEFGLSPRVVKLGTQEVIVDFKLDGEEITEQEDIIDRGVIELYSGVTLVGKFFPYEYINNVVLHKKKYHIKNKFELKCIMDESKIKP